MTEKMQLQDGKGKWNKSKCPPSYNELLGIDGEPIDFEWNILPGFLSLQILQEIQNDLRKLNNKLEKFTDRIIFMSMFNDTDWTRKGNDGIFYFEFRKSQDIRDKMLAWTLDVSRSWRREEVVWSSSLLYTPEGKWDSTTTQMVERFKDPGIPVFKSISALSRVNADASNTQLLFRTSHSANQMSIYGAVPSRCEEFGSEAE